MPKRTEKSPWLVALFAILTALATWALSADARAQGVPVDQATDEQKTEAREHFVKAKEAFGAQRYDEALEGFRASYNIVASPNSRIMIVQVLDAMGRSAEAYVEAEAVQQEAEAAAAADPKYAQTAEAAQQLKDAIRPNIGMLIVNVPPGTDPSATLTVNGREIPQEEWNTPIPVDAGMATVSLTGADTQEVSVAAGAEATVDMAPAALPPPEPEPEPEPEEGSKFEHKRTIAYIAGGVGAASLIMFAIFGSLASSAYSDLEDGCPMKIGCDPALQATADDGQTYQTVANVTLVIGIVGIAAGAGLFIWDLVEGDDSEAEEGGEEEYDEYAVVKPQLVVGPGSIAVRGRF